MARPRAERILWMDWPEAGDPITPLREGRRGHEWEPMEGKRSVPGAATGEYRGWPSR